MLMRTNMNEGDQRLLRAAELMREDVDPQNFTMRHYTDDWSERTGWCGTPQCVAGHYMMLTDEGAPMRTLTGERLMTWQMEHFDITREERSELFERDGCNNARSPAKAADYIERFVARRVTARSLV